MLESTLTRLLAVAQFYHFAFLVVSLALLGFAASGSLLSIFPGLLEGDSATIRFHKLGRLLAISGIGFAVSVGLAYVVVNLLPFDSYSIVWDRRQVVFFALYYLVLTIPFVFTGLGIGAALSSSSGKSNLVYAVNLLGSAAGIVLALLIMQLAGVPGALLACGLVGLAAVVGFDWSGHHIVRWMFWGLVAAGSTLLVALAWINASGMSPIGVTISPYKGLAYAVQIPGSERLYGAWNAISRLDVISGASTRVMPGLSYTFPESPPPQNGLAVDGDALQPVTLIDPIEFSAGDYLPEALAFQIYPQAEILVIQPGAGFGVLQAISGGAKRVTTVISNPLVLDAISVTSAETNVFAHEHLETFSGSGRVFLRTPGDQFDIIFLPLSDPHRPVASGAYSLAETYDLTVESIAAMLSRLSEHGLVVATRWLQTPPSETIRMFATILEALDSLGIDRPGERIVAYRGIQTMTILIKSFGWTKAELIELRNFANERRFDLVWAPDILTSETNRFNRLSEPVYYLQINELIREQDKKEFYSEFPFAIQPATDDHPFFFHFFKWAQTPQVLANVGRVWQPFGGSGYFVLIALLFLVSALSLLLIVFPLLIKRRPQVSESSSSLKNHPEPISKWRIFIYFGSIGLAFLFLEIPLIQRGILSLGHPIYAFTLVVLTVLISSSIGSLMSRREWLRKKLVLGILFGFALLTPIIVYQTQEITLGWALLPRILIFGLSLVPLGILMGYPFPIGLAWLERSDSSLIPWAWAVNGCASVLAAVLAAILALSFGFTLVLVLGAVFYGLAAIALKG